MELIKESYNRYLRDILSKDNATATNYDKYMALSYAVRSEMVERWIETQRRYHAGNVRRVYFLSTEYMFGRSLRQNIVYLDMERHIEENSAKLGLSLDAIYEEEDGLNLGNGGKARLAACMQDSMATLGIAATAYGLRYDYGLFKQEIRNGSQVEKPYDWLHKGHPWEIIRPEFSCEVGFYGKSGQVPGAPPGAKWNPAEKVLAVPFDFPVPGYKNRTVNTLRLWASRASEEFLPDYANHGDYIRACEDKSRSGTLTKVLFPETDVLRATELRLKQHYFLVCASLHDILRRFRQDNGELTRLHEKIVIQLSGSCCALAVPEFMRLLLDEENIPWDAAWNICSNLFAYTSHAISREGLETWPVYMMTQVLPRHMEIIYEINQKHLDSVRNRYGNPEELVRELSIIQEGEVKRVRMANLAILGSFRTNGVSVSQTELLQLKVFPEFFFISPAKFRNKTNGISHRRWMFSANRPLAELITDAIGDSWVRRPENLQQLEAFAEHGEFLRRLASVRAKAKKDLAAFIKKRIGVEVDPEALLDVHCKKIHLYKRQALHALGILAAYLRLKSGADAPVNRVHLFAGKAAPADQLAKQVINLIHATASIVNNDPMMKGRLRVVFLPDYDVTLAERIVPAADLSEQIATPGQEACGTSNAKFAINGALTIAARGGSNLEMIERIGEENMFVFGKRAEDLPAPGEYDPYGVLTGNKDLSAIFALLEERLKSLPHDGRSINPLLSTLKDSDPYFVLIDFNDYVAKQRDAEALFADRNAWLRKSVYNIARSGWFSIDRTVAEYAREIWKVIP